MYSLHQVGKNYCIVSCLVICLRHFVLYSSGTNNGGDFPQESLKGIYHRIKKVFFCYFKVANLVTFLYLLLARTLWSALTELLDMLEVASTYILSFVNRRHLLLAGIMLVWLRSLARKLWEQNRLGR